MAKKSTAAKAKHDVPDPATGKTPVSAAKPAKAHAGKSAAKLAKTKPATIEDATIAEVALDAAPDTSAETVAPATRRSDADTTRAKTSKAKKSVASEALPRKKVVVLTTTEIGEHLASTFAIPKTHAKIYISEAVALIGKNLKKGNKVRIAGLGVFQVKKRPARKGHNPNTGEPMKIKAGKRVGFVASRDLKASL